MPTKNDIAERIMVALDFASAERTRELLDKLRGISCYMKVGMELFYAAGPQLVRELKAEGYRVFVDLKLHDIPNTVKGAAASIARLEADMFNVHASGGLPMMQAALEGVEQALAENANLSRPIVIGVTQLTSTSRAVLNEQIGIPGSVEEAVKRYASLAKQAGLSGVVASPREVRTIKKTCGDAFLTVTPGIRPAGSAAGDQTRIMTPQEAFGQGTDYIVIGRPITASPDPRGALKAIIESIGVNGR